MSKHVLVPVDWSDQSMRALDKALEMFPDAALTLIYVFSTGPMDEQVERMGLNHDELRERRENMLNELLEERGVDRAVKTMIEFGTPSWKIIEVAEEMGADHIVMGSHGRDGLSRVILGSVAENVTRRAPVPVTIVR